MNHLHIKDLELLKNLLKESLAAEEIYEIRQIRVFLENKKYLINKSPFFLILFSNDWIDFDSFGNRDNSMRFYTITQKNKLRNVIGIQVEEFKNGTRRESLVYYKKINWLLYKLLINKFNAIWISEK